MGLNSQTAATFIRRHLTPPVFENDENKTLIARALHFVSLWASATLVFIGINAALFAKEKPSSLLFIFVGIGLTYSVHWQMRRGNVRRASFMLVSFGWAIVTLFVYLSGGLSTISSALYVTVIIMAALFLGWRTGVFVVVLSLLLVLPLGLADVAGYSVPRFFPLGGMTNWLLMLYIFILVLIMVISIESGLREALHYAREQLHEREKAEKALRESEERFRLISSVTSDYTFSSGFNDKGELEYLLLTGAFEAITSYTPEEFRRIGGWQAVLHPDDLAKDARDMTMLQQNQKVVTDMRIIRKDGQMRWVRVYADPVWDAERGKLLGINGAGQDITEQKTAEEALRESEERFRLISSVTSDYTFSSRVNRDGSLNHLMVTGAFEAIMGYTPDEYLVIGGWRAVLCPDDLEQDARDMAALQQNQKVVTDVRIIRKGGDVRWVRVYAHPVWDAEQGRLVTINGAVQDINEQKLAEEALRESEARFRLISTVISDYTFSTALNLDGTLEYRMLTGAFEAISGYTPEEYRHGGGWLRMLHPDDVAQDAHDMDLVRQNQRVESEVRIIRKDGGVRWVRVYAHPVWDAEQGRVVAINGAVKDITEQKLAEEALREGEERFRLISSVTSDYTFSSRVNAQGGLEHTLLTGAFEAISGYTPEEFMARGGWRTTVHPDDVEQDQHDMDVLLKNQRVVSELRVIKKDGEVRWVRVYAHPVWDPELGHLVRINGAVQDITEQKLAEMALMESEERYRKIFDLNAAGITTFGPGGKITGINKAALKRIGRMSVDDVLGKSMTELGLISDSEILKGLLRQLEASGGVLSDQELLLRRADGSTYTVLYSAVKFEIHGEPHLLTMTVDITARKQAEEALRQNEKLLRALQDATTDVIFLMSPDGTLLTVNKRLADMDGLTIESMVGKSAFNNLNPELVAERRKQFDRVIETKQPNRWVDLNAPTWWDNNIYPVLSLDGEVEAFAVYARDITEQKRLEAEVEHYTERLEQMVEERTVELRQAKEQIELILNNTSDAVALALADGDIQTANPAYYEMFGAQVSQAIERLLSMTVREEQAVAISDSLLRVIHQGESRQLEIQITGPDGTTRDIDLSLIPVRLRLDDARCGILVNAHDITSLKEVERFKADFVAKAVHDLGNPITGLLMRIQVLKATPERLAEHATALENQMKHFGDIVEDLRTLSHIDQNQLWLRLAASNINQVVKRVFDTYEAVALNKQQTLKFKPDKNLPDVWVDARQLERVVVNLVTNAINYTPEGKLIEITTGLENEQVIISVKDQGMGIDSKETARIFDRFYRTPTARKANSNGTGLGLAIVKEITELHGGSVTVKSKPGHGSTFTVRLPLQR